MKRLGVYGLVILAIAVISLGCSNEKKLLRQQVAAQVDTLSQLRGNLQSKSDSLQNAMTSLNQARMVLDSVNGKIESFQQRIRRLNSQLKQAEDVNVNLRTSLDQSMAIRDSISAYYQKAIADSSGLLTQFRADIFAGNSAIAERDSLLEQIRPWYMKWKHDAHRSFIKVLFGAGKSKTPDFAEPSLEAKD